MSAISSMSTAISGLESNGEELSIISDNIVNANTTGFKSSRGEFHTILATDLNSAQSGSSIGRGTELAGVTGLFTQGSITKTDRPTDMAIQGNGFFVLKGDSNHGTSYTRDGSFRFDKDGWLTALNGERVQCFQATPEGKLTGKLGDLRIPYKTIPARATGTMQVNLNLDSRAPLSREFDPEHPEETSGYTTTAQVFDSVGTAHALSLHFNRVGQNRWSWVAMTDGSGMAGGTPGKQMTVAKGSLSFDELGRLANSEQDVVNSSFAGAIPDQKLFFDFGDPTDKGGTGVKGTTHYGSKNATFRTVQDGFSAGILSGTDVDDNGIISGSYTNGQSVVIGQVSLARFESTERLNKMGGNQFSESAASGKAIVGRASTNGFGAVVTKSLEQSNVDIAKEFVDMIKAQRGFQASAKSINSANEMLDEVIKLART